ncbi:acyl-CoA dehydrogenase family protein [Sphingomonas sp. KC8]|uniref:acyl-CoA dehydrogenase family protein n=1 Tax=Sphingomonas sp. KC8 TaxID=1030157 RepID=UPI0002489FC7|nr:acyl-CoA dehydrogenase family protein [Sphingomonas sp. KC8]ARS29487.1 flavin-dependent monooxygenase oxygenase subunit [Sphingomonas sp. KC8]
MATAASRQSDFQAAPTAEELIARARAMAETLRQRARQTTLDGDVPAETIAEMAAAGFFRILQPQRYGGYEMLPDVFYEVQKALAEGCMSTGWVYGVLGCHPYQLALFDDKAQQEVWGDDPATRVSSSYQPVGKVEKADGGFYLSGRWGFSSGSSHCSWVLLGSIHFPEEGPPDLRTFLLPRSDYQVIKGTWDVSGLQGTGSFDIVVDRAFVPEYRTHKSIDGFLCTNPGQKENDGPLYRLPWAQVFVRAVSTSAFGSARAAIRAGLDIMNSRVSSYTGKAAKGDPLLHAALARAVAEVGEMELTQRVTLQEMIDHARRGEVVPMERRALFAYQSSTVVRRMADLIDDIVKLLGGRAVYMSSPIMQPWLDLHAARAHIANDPGSRAADVLATMAGAPPSFNYL